jgi:SAM-dependent methyltransferase
MEISKTISKANAAKAAFDDIYDQPDPRSYVRSLRALEYQIPQNAKPWFRQIFQTLRGTRGQKLLRVLDLGSSYGFNAALLRYDLDLDPLFHRYVGPEVEAANSDWIRERDARFFENRECEQGLWLLGLDAAARAVTYAEDVHLVNTALACDLETEDLEPTVAAKVASTDVVISTGCVGYVTRKTFKRILANRERSKPPWVVSFVLRMFPYEGIAETLTEFRLTTARLSGRTFVQRRFADVREQEDIVAQLEKRGLRVAGLEAEGYLHAELFLSVPGGDVVPAGLRESPWQVVAAP